MRWIVALVCLQFVPAAIPQSGGAASPEVRAVAHLVSEVPAWSRENGCYSCHNNGDGARALLLARSLGYAVPHQAIDDTLRWLRQPDRWEEGAKHPMASDTRLARLHFATALSLAGTLGEKPPNQVLARNAQLLAMQQSKDGAWHVDTGSMVGSPITWGSTLATVLAADVLAAADGAKYAAHTAQARSWLRSAPRESVLDTAAVLIAFPDEPGMSTQLIAALLQAQNADGGWGPQPRQRAETFDTAIVLIALARLRPQHQPLEAISKGRAFLIGQQLETGGWPETTRPSGSSSYAHHISTSAWATIALLRTHPER
ncbi:MAG: terpene cyclase/mutase family protein [Bryobacterales bacterium]|nr:terpene cyclase/mutase family protein [Bryobacterales bacterium]